MARGGVWVENSVIKATRKPNQLPLQKLYRENNSFFITVCCYDQQNLLGTVSGGKVNLYFIGKKKLKLPGMNYLIILRMSS
jgi:hypothetical protein